ncbi:hypothetical protein F1188_16140 [Roseospira marina]|uniref:Uncharacterized protein n=1 Tax=Roseospira marina TaxID=140057 RepID=A0A5M6I816_9PROT|nr:hypothetical protein [Roseospira marina]KAA5604390.1 hypothetical protein F1188_16140 [Roseospira marina]MBB4315421.1 hypothetical protein [Roseospira marina]MBB5088434.1 hypothetical protein [Roseospira marina]
MKSITPMSGPIETGDAGVVLTAAGEVKVFTTETYPENPDEWSAAMVEQSNTLRLMALIAADANLQQTLMPILEALDANDVQIMTMPNAH